MNDSQVEHVSPDTDDTEWVERNRSRWAGVVGVERRRSDMILEKTFSVLTAALAVVAGGCATDSGPPTATFSGTTCAYDGLPEFTPGDVVTVTFNNKSDVEAGLGIVKILDGTSIDEVANNGLDAFADEAVTSGVGMSLPGESTSFEFQFSVEGDWLVNCFTDTDYPATILEVSG